MYIVLGKVFHLCMLVARRPRAYSSPGSRWHWCEAPCPTGTAQRVMPVTLLSGIDGSGVEAPGHTPKRLFFMVIEEEARDRSPRTILY